MVRWLTQDPTAVWSGLLGSKGGTAYGRFHVWLGREAEKALVGAG